MSFKKEMSKIEERFKKREQSANFSVARNLYKDLFLGEKDAGDKARQTDNYTFGSPRTMSTEIFMQADKLIRDKNYFGAITVLESMSAHLEVNPKLVPDHAKYAGAIQRRAYRISNRLEESNPEIQGKTIELDRRAVALVEEMKSKYGVSPHRALENSVAVVAIAGLASGTLFLSSNATGNVIGLSSTTSSWIGGVLILIGLIALGFWIKNKKNRRAFSRKVIKSSQKPKKRK